MVWKDRILIFDFYWNLPWAMKIAAWSLLLCLAFLTLCEYFESIPKALPSLLHFLYATKFARKIFIARFWKHSLCVCVMFVMIPNVWSHFSGFWIFLPFCVRICETALPFQRSIWILKEFTISKSNLVQKLIFRSKIILNHFGSVKVRSSI